MKLFGALALAAVTLACVFLSASAHTLEVALSVPDLATGRRLMRTQPQEKPEEEKPAEEPKGKCYYIDLDNYKEQPYGYKCEEEKDDYGKVIKYRCCKYEKPVEEYPEDKCYYVDYEEYKDAPEPKYGYKCEEEKDDYGKIIKYKCCKYEKPVEEYPEDKCYYVDYEEYKDAPEPKYGYKCEEEKDDYGKVIKYKCCQVKEPTKYDPPKPKCKKSKWHICCLVAKKYKHLYKDHKCVKITRGFYSCCKKIPQPPKPVCIYKKFGKKVKKCCKTDDSKKYKYDNRYSCFRKFYKGKKITFCCKRY